jgi:hypothetical protein
VEVLLQRRRRRRQLSLPSSFVVGLAEMKKVTTSIVAFF